LKGKILLPLNEGGAEVDVDEEEDEIDVLSSSSIGKEPRRKERKEFSSLSLRFLIPSKRISMDDSGEDLEVVEFVL